MRRPPDGAPFVPPNPICPASQRGTIPDLRTAPFQLNLEADLYTGKVIEIFGCFGVYTPENNFQPKDYVETENWKTKPGSPVAERVRELLRADPDEWDPVVSSTENDFAEKVRQRLCGGVAECNALVTGKCALGASALREALEQTLEEFGEHPS